ncbi:MAG TPA: pitrilysin family protein [Bacteroidia bacterium]|jgi:zinc protease|nr:pitrilysin family protein [Bacteroidia bacterium]
MKKQLLFFSFLFIALTSFAQQKTKLVETVTTNGKDALVIPYTKYLLPNGLTLVVHEDHSDPVVYVDVTYHVGSAREQEGRSGFAHFFEHMMFQGSGHVADEEHFRLISEAGGDLNGSTNTDRTNYFETVPSNYLEMAMWLEADRMGFLLDSVTQQKFEIQRSTVKNERGQNYDNRPYGLVWEKIGEAMYPEGHPYSWETIGYIEDLNRANVQDLRNFFMRWYGPNNATLTIAGDVKTADVLKFAEKYFGTIARGPEVKPMAKMPAVLTSDRCISYEDNIRNPQLTIARPGVATWDADEAPLDALCDIISSGKSSVFYKTFIETKIAKSANMYSATMELAGQIAINIQTYPGHSPHEADSLLNVALAEFEKRGVTDDDVQRYKLTVESYYLDNLTSVQGKGSQLAAYNTFTGNPNMIQKDLDRYKNIKKEDVMRVYNKYIKGKAAVVLTVLPKGHPEMKARPDNFTPPPYKNGTEESAEYKNLVYNRPVDNFDRFVHPVPGPTPVVVIPALWHDTYTNGLKLIGTNSTEIPRTYMQLTISAGHRQEDTASSGTAYLLVKMLDQSTLKHSAADIETKLELLGSDVGISVNSEEITVNITCFTRNIDSTLALVYEKLFQPKFDATEFDLMKRQQLESIANMPTQAGSMASLVFNKMLFGADNIMAYPTIGTASTVNRITLDDVKAYYKKMFSPNISQFITVSDLTKDQLTPKLKPLQDWMSTNAALKPVTAITAQPGPTKIYLFNKPDAAQSEIRIGRTGIPYDYNGEFYKATMMNYELGGMFNSHINLKLREEKGWTYGAGSGFGGTLYPGYFVAYAGVRYDASDSAVAEFVNVMKDYAANGISDEELQFTKRSISQSEALAYEDPFQKIAYMKRIVYYGLPDNYSQTQNQTLMSLTKPDIDALAKKWIDPDHMVVTVVGDKSKIYDGLLKLGYEVIEVDANGNPMPKAATTNVQQPQQDSSQNLTGQKGKKKKNLKMRNH